MVLFIDIQLDWETMMQRVVTVTSRVTERVLYG